MKPDRPLPNRRTFSSRWDEIKYLYFKAGHWMYLRGRSSRAKPFIRRLRNLTHRLQDESLCVLAARGLLADWDGDLRGELRCKQRQVGQLLKLMKVSTNVPNCRPSNVLDEMEILALLLEENGRRSDGLKMVGACAAFARKYKLAFKAKALRARILE